MSYDITSAVFGTDPVPADLAALRADATYGDGIYNGPAFSQWQHVVLGDASSAYYATAAAAWASGAAPPTLPLAGSIIADLETLRAFVGASSTVDDTKLQQALDASAEWIYERVMQCVWDHPGVQHAILLLASRLYKRRQSPEGTAGFGGEGVVVRILASDPDVRAEIERHLDMLCVGVG